jgi:hypothetical protein
VTTERIAEIRKRIEAASKGPWDFDVEECCWHVTDECIAFLMECRDAKFTAHARTDLPEVLDALELALKENERLKDSLRALESCLLFPSFGKT